MRKITAQELNQIRDLATEKNIWPGIVEKDLYVTDVIGLISEMATRNLQIQPVFCGGTCLSKAHKAVDRMSEDIDFKLATPNVQLSNSQQRTAFGNFCKMVVSELRNAGFKIDEADIRSRNNNRNINLSLAYPTAFESVAVLRQHIQLEFTASELRLEPITKPINTMLGEATGAMPSFAISCLNINETIAEKIVSFTRRVGAYLRGVERGEFDKSLVRHIFDVHQILNAQQLTLDHQFRAMTQEIMRQDAEQFRNQYEQYADDPRGETLKALESLESNPDFKIMYDKFVEDMVFAQDPPTFETAAVFFSDIAKECLLSHPKSSLSM